MKHNINVLPAYNKVLKIHRPSLRVHLKQVLIKAYSLHDLRSVGISNKNEFNTAKMAQFTWFQQAFMVNGHYMYM